MSNRSGTTYSAPTDADRRPVMLGASTADGITPLPLEVDPVTGQLQVSGGGGGGGGGGTVASLYTGQQTVGTTQVQLTASSNTLSNGIVVKAPTTNGAAVYVGLTGVTTTTGDMIEPGEARGYAVNNTNLLYFISVASTTDKVTYSGN